MCTFGHNPESGKLGETYAIYLPTRKKINCFGKIFTYANPQWVQAFRVAMLQVAMSNTPM